MFQTTCPSCRDSISFKEKLQVGQNIVCPTCRELLIVKSLDPLEVDLYAFTTQSDWGNAEKLEAAKRHQRRNKHRREDFEDFDEDELEWRKGRAKKAKNRMHEDW